MSDLSDLDDTFNSFGDSYDTSDLEALLDEEEMQAAEFRAPNPDVIDLTEEPDSPVRPIPAHPVLLLPSINDPVRNPLPNPAHGYHSRTPPRQPRTSDFELAGPRRRIPRQAPGHTGVIDLTLEDSPQQTRLSRSNNQAVAPQNYRSEPQPEPDLWIVGEARNVNPPPHSPRNFHGQDTSMGYTNGFNIGATARRLHDANNITTRFMRWTSPAQTFGNQVVSMFFGERARPIPTFEEFTQQYNPAAFAPPPREPPPPQPQLETREGFTRSTGEDLEMVCPACDNALEFDPNEDRESGPTRKRTKRDQAEHYFWAVKACGHVYCYHCYENRRSTKKDKAPAFRHSQETGTKILCAVENCKSEVGNKGAWIGLFM
ncbi:hypothetical protein BROUX41_003378 [Berkeleyomyces rouxiae]|uniref:uncharacterized protein n=1 Tax=Berkeleyomyces rouxiae TaxID=2035830 RepID=UPI003B7944F7